MSLPDSNFEAPREDSLDSRPGELAAALTKIISVVRQFTTRSASLAQAPLLPEHRVHLGRKVEGALSYKPYTVFRPRPINAGPSVLHAPHPAASTPAVVLSSAFQSQSSVFTFDPAVPQPTITLSTQVAPPSQFSIPASTAVTVSLESHPVTSFPTESPLDSPVAGSRIDRRNRRTYIPPDALSSRRGSSRSRSPDMSRRASTPYAATGRQPLIFSASPPLNHITENDISMDDAEHQAPVFIPLIKPQAPSPSTQMTDTSTSPIIGSRSTDFSHQTPSPARPFPLPSAIEDHLNRLVAQRFLELSDHVLVPALKNAVDTSIPSVVERISNDMRNATISPQLRSRADKGNTSDTQSSDDEDDLKPSPRRKRPGKRGLKNDLHVALRNYLRENGLLKGENCPLPRSPPLETLHDFNDNNDCSPTLGNISVDWNDSLKKSPWNTEVINILVIDFQAKVSNGTFVNLLVIDFEVKVGNGTYEKVIFDAKTMSLENLRTLCIKKLRRTQFQYRQHVQIGKIADVEDMNRASRELCNTQKHGTLERRQKIVEQNRHRNTDIWDMIKRIIDRLDVEGMSGDETDTAPGVTPKVVSPDITQLLHAVESYAPATHEENMTVPIGNSSLQRISEQKRMLHMSIAIQQLPRNWYNDDWYKANSSSARALLGARKTLALPLLQPYCSQTH
ncbi:hypothetical protein C8R48DRAFT_671469 [Suillus tomentosus]|nr:hypothetical protein C8R48DRAFT_671469 [Suillus tomentosus]